MIQHLIKISFFLLISMIGYSCQTQPNQKNNETAILDTSKVDTATFAGGCFWCVEASFEQIKGVYFVVSGYAGGKEETAFYKLVSTGITKHAESVQIYYDPTLITYDKLLDIFFTTHDPTQLNRQGPDVGPQYRSAIFYHNQMQKALADQKIKSLSPRYSNPIVTVVDPYKSFYLAEDYHQNYEENNPYNPYIQNVSKPKIERVKKEFKDILKE